MEKKIKTLYILSIIAIIAFLIMQGYWLYNRYEYQMSEYEDSSREVISKAIAEYNRERLKHSIVTKVTRTQSSFQMNTDTDTAGYRQRKVTVTTKELDGRKILGIAEERKLTPEEMERLSEMVIDSIDMAEARIATVDASSAPSDGIAWNAMKNFDTESQSPFTTVGIDSILGKSNLIAETSLILLDSVIWDPVVISHSSVFSPRFKEIIPYSELERKAVVIECEIPSSDILRNMGWTLALAFVLSLFLILCLVWQIKTIVKLTRLDRMRNSFITTMIHELKRPISTLKMCVSGLDNDRLLQDAQVRRDLTGETRVALDNLSAYFSKLRDITFNNVEQIPLNITLFNLSELVDNVIASLPHPGTKEITYVNNVPRDLEMSADRTHLINILTNLIENAIKYSGEQVTIKVTAQSTSDGVHISIEDNGIGISAADNSRIFNRFYRGKASTTDIPGMGLGLAYVKLLIEAHGGSISVESREGEGSTFLMNIPQ